MKPDSVNRMLEQRRCKHLAEVIERVKNKDHNLDSYDRYLISTVLEQIQKGYDARAYFGIAPKRGARQHHEGDHRWITLYFLKLRAEDPDKLEKAHRGTVCDECGLSDSALRKIVKQQSAFCRPILDSFTLETFREFAIKCSPRYAQEQNATENQAVSVLPKRAK